MIFAHSRFQVWNQNQHPFRHTAADFGYANPALPPGSVTNMEQTLDWIFAVLYPNQQDAVATVADLPSVGNVINDMRVVLDDGDGKAASYRWEQREGDAVAKWYKIYDMDWGYDSILSGFLLDTQDVFVSRHGRNDLDSTGALLTGVNAGQHIWGGLAASSHLTLHANAGDGVGSQTGYIQMADNVRPITNSAWSLGTTAERWLKVWTDALTSGTLTAVAGSITDSSGAISFDNENLSTTGTIASGTHTIGNMVLASASITNSSGAISFDNENLTTTGTLASGTHTIGTLVLAAGSITDTSGSISFDNENLLTTGTLGAGAITGTQLNIDNLRLDGNTLSSLSGALNLSAATVVDIQSAMTTIGQTVTGVVGITGQLNIDNLRLDGNTLSVTASGTDLILTPGSAGGRVRTATGYHPVSDATGNLGAATFRFTSLYLSSSISDGTDSITTNTLMSLRDINVGVGSGYSIFWDGSKWVASLPDTEIDHGIIGGLGDDDHTQYALLLGRSGGQTLYGGTASGNSLNLRSTSHATKGTITSEGNFLAFTSATYDLGASATTWKDLYLSGQAIGLRVENYTTAGRPSATVGTAGRLYWDTDLEDIYVNRAGTWKKASVEKYVIQDAVTWDGSTSTKTYTVSTEVSDARECIWVLKNNSDTYKQVACDITMSQTQVTVTVDIPLAAGTYTLVGVG